MVTGLICIAVQRLGDVPGGRALAFALGLGAVLGVVLQRSRFCFYCHARDYFERDDARGLLAIVAALAVGTVGMHVVMTGWLPVPLPGRLPPDAHIGPVSWALVLAGLAFGLGMVISGSCISAHWYRLGEGSPTAPFALVGAAAGFLLGFNTWNALYSATIATAPVVWLPQHLGYAGSVVLQLAVLALLAAWLWRRLPAHDTADEGAPPPRAASFISALSSLRVGRWPHAWGGVAVGAIAVLVVLRLKPLGVTSALGGTARDWGDARNWLPSRLEGLDGFGGCATAVAEQLWQLPNAWLVAGIVAGAWAAALASAQAATPHLAAGRARPGRRRAARLGRDDRPWLHGREPAFGNHGRGPVGLGLRCRGAAGGVGRPAAALGRLSHPRRSRGGARAGHAGAP